MKNHSHFSSRIGIRAVVAGMMTSSALMLLLMSGVAAMGMWNYMPKQLADLGGGFWLASALAWTISMFVAGFVAASASRSESVSDGVFNALTACSGTFLFFALAFVVFGPDVIDRILEDATLKFFYKIFYINLIAYVVGAFGGLVGVRFENRVPAEHSKKIRIVVT